MVCQMFFKCYYISEIQKLYIVPIFLQFPNFYLTIGQSFLDHINNIQLELLVHSYLHGSDFVAVVEISRNEVKVMFDWLLNMK